MLAPKVCIACYLWASTMTVILRMSSS